MKAHPFGISAPLGINIPSTFEISQFGELNNETDWSFLKDSDVLLECFGGNHLLEATQQLYDECKNHPIISNYFQTRLCTVYYGLTDDEIIKVKTFQSLY